MDLHQLRCFVATAEALHFGRAAQRLGMLPAALGRHIRLLEEDLGTRLLLRTTRNVALTEDGAALIEEARDLLARADGIAARLRTRGRDQAISLRIGAIDSAAAGSSPCCCMISASGGPMLRSSWSRRSRSACCRGCARAGSTSPSSARRSCRTRRSNCCSCSTKPPS
ncbi:MAG: LysR family transcriptional regulator [Aliidongia sp.]